MCYSGLTLATVCIATNQVTVSSKKKLKWRSQARFHHLEINTFGKPFG